MRTFVFAIGGTGARVLRSISMLMAAGCGKLGANDEIVPIIIDYDIENGDTKQTQNLLLNYKYVHDAAYGQAQGIDGLFFAAPLNRFKDKVIDASAFDPHTNFEVFIKPGDSNKTFAQHIGYNSLTAENGTLPTKDLLTTLYDTSDEKSATAELELNLHVGFKGCPNIGCVVMRNIKDTKEMMQFLAPFPVQGDRIIIIGSIFGGTGASGIPVILDAIKTTDGMGNIPVGILAVEPYFKVSDSPTSAINTATFMAKTKAALDAYLKGNSVNMKADWIYYVGDRFPSTSLPNCEGGINQMNPAHMVEMLGAYCVLDFAKNVNVTTRPGMKAETNIVVLNDGAGYRDDKPKEFVITDFAPLAASDSDSTLWDQLIVPLCKFSIFSVFCDKFLTQPSMWKKNDMWLGISNDKDPATGMFNQQELIGAIGAFVKEFEKWIMEMEQEQRPMKLFNFWETAQKEFATLFYGLHNQESGLFGKSAVINISKINEAMNNEFKKVQNDQKYKDSLPGYRFFTILAPVMQQMFDKVLENTNKQNKK